jgi:hypothetical protein
MTQVKRKKFGAKKKIIIINFLKRNGKTVTAINLYTYFGLAN